ncbi:P-loop NTPase fold protein [Carnobacterium sp. FSL E2-0243]|uniref:P-loop NTPase fold protein n=1 Tax=Carnobacterium sp. FSL E2-0243 TaxID=2921365 RepID=UPI0030F8C8E4
MDPLLERNNHIVKYLDRYIVNKKNKFAVMIDGEWGTGKSYFVKKYIELQNESERKIFTISAFGLNEIIELENLIIDSISGESGIIKKAIRKFAGNTNLDINLGFVGTKISGEELLENFKKSIETEVKKNGDSLIIIDDFERTNINFSEILGFCSRLIFENDMKVVLVCNESKLRIKKEDNTENNNNNLYFEFKEKVIGKTFILDSDVDTAFKAFSDEIIVECKIESSEKKDLVYNSMDKVNERIKEVVVNKNNNLRVYQYALSDMIYFIEEVFNHAYITEDFIRENHEYFEKIIYMKMVTYLADNGFFYLKMANGEKSKLNSTNFINKFFVTLGMDASIPLMEKWDSINLGGDFSKYADLIKNEIEVRKSETIAENSPMSQIKYFLDNLYDLVICGITDIAHIKENILRSDFYDIGEMYHYLCIVAFLKEKDLINLNVTEEFNEFLGKNKKFRTRSTFDNNTTGYLGYAFLLPNVQMSELLRVKETLIIENATFYQKNEETLLKSCESIVDISNIIEELKTKSIPLVINISSIFDDRNLILPPKKIVEELINTKYSISENFLNLLNQSQVMNTLPLLHVIKNELTIIKGENPKSFNDIKIDKLIIDTRIFEKEFE